MSDGRWWLGSGIAAAIALVAPPLAAAPIEWEAPEGCPGSDVVLAELQRALGSDPLDADARAARAHDTLELGAVSRVRGVVVTEPGEKPAATPRYRLTLEVIDERRRSTRSFEAEHCADLARMAALAISLAVHAGNAGATGAAAHGAEPTPNVAPAASTDPEADLREPRRDANPGAAAELWWSAGPNALLDVGALPDPALGLGLGARAGLDPFELQLHGLLLPSQQLSIGAGDAARFGLMAAGLRACLHLLDRALIVGGCLGVEAGRLTATGIDLQPGREVHDPWLATGLAALARTAFEGPLQLEILAEPLLPLARKQYAVNGTDVVHSPSVMNVRFQLGLVIGGSNRAGSR